MSVRLYISKITCPDFMKYSMRVKCGHSSVILWRQCNTLCTSGLWMTSCFHIIEHVWCTARLTAERCQSAGGNAEKGGLRPAGHLHVD